MYHDDVMTCTPPPPPNIGRVMRFRYLGYNLVILETTFSTYSSIAVIKEALTSNDVSASAMVLFRFTPLVPSWYHIQFGKMTLYMEFEIRRICLYITYFTMACTIKKTLLVNHDGIIISTFAVQWLRVLFYILVSSRGVLTREGTIILSQFWPV